MAELDLQHFLPYLLAQTAERSSQGFARVYKDRYGMLRTDWRVLFHLGIFGDMTAREICARAGLHKTKVSRAVARLEERRFLKRSSDPSDRRVEHLTLTAQGRSAYVDLRDFAATYEIGLLRNLSETEAKTLKALLLKL
ncbi:MarR family winged helix-turn-helix transcriptional regulator [Roseobacteraceae bacterium S113]